MIQHCFLSPVDRYKSLSCVKRQREDHEVARRANALLLLDGGESCAQIAKILYLDDDTIRSWFKQYHNQGWVRDAYDGWKSGQLRMTVAQEPALRDWPDARFCCSTV